jgi:glycosyltransferase involved in cell wall biosynthesis
VKLSVCIITLNEEANIGRTLKSVQPLVADGEGEIIVVDSGSTDKTLEIAKSFGAKVFTEPWKGFAAQKNSALEKAQGEWILSLDADEEVDSALLDDLREMPFVWEYWQLHKMPLDDDPESRRLLTLGLKYKLNFGDVTAYYVYRKNHFLSRWIRHGGFWPEFKLRFFRREAVRFEDRLVHEDARLMNPKQLSFTLGRGTLVHHAYPTLSGYIEHMNKYSSLGAEMEVEKGRKGFSLTNIVIRPWLTFIYNYIFRLGFLDGKEGLLLHMYHAVYVSWKYAKVWEQSRASKG